MDTSDFVGWALGTLIAVLLLVALSQGCRKVEKGVPAADLYDLYNECGVFTIEERRFVVCQSGRGLAITPLETQCNPK